jgi:flavin reductase (DIM6/NTAB) family NADH-FMN oxidoreductase RutF
MAAEFELPDTMKLHPTRHPVVGTAQFRAAMSAMADTVCVVTGRSGEEEVGRTVTSMLSLSLSPPTILVSIDMTSRLADVIARTGGFSLAVLAEDQQVVGDAFAGRLDPDERFASGTWARWPSGRPMLLGAATALDCEVIGSIETGSHVLFAGAVVEAETTTSRKPLLWQRHGYHGLGDLDGADKS